MNRLSLILSHKVTKSKGRGKMSKTMCNTSKKQTQITSHNPQQSKIPKLASLLYLNYVFHNSNTL